VRASQVCKSEDLELAIKQDVTFTTPEHVGKIASVSAEGQKVQITLVLTSAGPGSSGTGTSSSSSSGGITNSPYWLKSPASQRVYPNSMTTQTSGQTATCTLSFNSAVPPTGLVVHVVKERSYHDIDFTVSNVELP
jgi:hypothetical protein